MFASYAFPPTLLLKSSICLSLLTGIVISARAGDSAGVLRACAATFGLAISWQFGAMYSFLAEKMDVVV